jgi:hypothetical protein
VPVYFIGEQESGCCRIKIGVAKDIEKRRSNLQTGNPSELRLLGWIHSEAAFELERRLHQHFRATHIRGEWFAIEPADILPILMRATSEGFLEIDECCPFCGCLCGMAFQDASQMYHCISCDALTDFSELSYRHDEPED